MRMKKFFTLIVVVLSIIAFSFASMYYIYYISDSKNNEYHVSFLIKNHTTIYSANIPDGQTREYEIEVNYYNITQLIVYFTWLDNKPIFGNSAKVTVSFSDPNKTIIGPNSNNDGNIGIILKSSLHNKQPDDINILAQNELSVWKKIFKEFPPTLDGHGTWILTVTVKRDGYAINPGSIDYDCKLIVICYNATLIKK